jgi:hypothetical protein
MGKAENFEDAQQELAALTAAYDEAKDALLTLRASDE